MAFFKFFIIVYSVTLTLSILSSKSNGGGLTFRLHKLFLLGASYYFYAYWDWRFLSLIIASTLADYWTGQKIYRTSLPDSRRFFLFCSLAVNFGILGFFKYCNFFLDSANFLLADAGLSIPFMEIVLPIGISFYTFQSMSYSLDIYFGKIEPVRIPIDFFLYVAFFPQLVAGPIVRASEFLPQLTKPVSCTVEYFFKGLQIFLYGLFLKVVVADNIAPIIDPIFKSPSAYDNLAIWTATLGYATQIFCDFCGYSEMAIGVALSIGYRLPINFRTPYLSISLFDFWRRWHISLSSWLRDYLYIPLGGNRKGLPRTCVNVFIVMLLGGLWHGANWRFILWGIWHGFGLLMNRILEHVVGSKLPNNALINFGKWLITFIFVCFGWVLFRAETLDQAKIIYSKLLFLEFTEMNPGFLNSQNLFFIPCMLLLHVWFAATKRDSVFFKSGSFACHLFIVMTVLLIFLFAPLDHKGFIYFQF